MGLLIVFHGFFVFEEGIKWSRGTLFNVVLVVSVGLRFCLPFHINCIDDLRL